MQQTLINHIRGRHVKYIKRLAALLAPTPHFTFCLLMTTFQSRRCGASHKQCGVFVVCFGSHIGLETPSPYPGERERRPPESAAQKRVHFRVQHYSYLFGRNTQRCATLLVRM